MSELNDKIAQHARDLVELKQELLEYRRSVKFAKTWRDRAATKLEIARVTLERDRAWLALIEMCEEGGE